MTDPFRITEPTCISFSGGRTSAYMLWRVLQSNNGLPPDAVVCFANTGKEEEATLRFVQDCSERWNVPITWLEYRVGEEKFAVVDFATASRNGEPFEALIRYKKYLPNPVARFCTQDLKVLTLERYMASIGLAEHQVLIGVRKDEQHRAAKLRGNKYCPLVDANVGKSDVQSFWSQQDFDLGLRFANGVTALGNCDLCYLKGGSQITSLIADKPERAVWWATMEKVIGGTFRSDRPTYQQMMDFTRDQMPLFTDETISCFCGD